MSIFFFVSLLESLPFAILFPLPHEEFFPRQFINCFHKEIIAIDNGVLMGDPMLRQETIDALFLILCNHLIMAAKKTAPDQTLSMPYQEQLQFIRLNLSSELPNRPTIENYAAKLGISSSYFQHLYTKTFGISFQKDLIRIRVEQAKYYLTTTDLTLSQIAEVCGYTNEVHFYRQFKQSTRMTPARFRKGGV